MPEIHAQMDKLGRLLIPYAIRNKLQYKPGDKFIIKEIEEKLQIISMKNAIKTAQELVEEHHKGDVSMVDEFIDFKRKEANVERDKF